MLPSAPPERAPATLTVGAGSRVAASTAEIRAMLGGRSRSAEQAAADDEVQAALTETAAQLAGLPDPPNQTSGQHIGHAHQAVLAAHLLMLEALPPGPVEMEVLARALRRWFDFKAVVAFPCADDRPDFQRGSGGGEALPPLAEVQAQRAALLNAAYSACDALARMTLTAARAVPAPPWPLTRQPRTSDVAEVTTWTNVTLERQRRLRTDLLTGRAGIITG